MATGEENKTDLTAKALELTKENEELKTKLKAFEDANKANIDTIAAKDGEIARLNKILVDNLLTGKDPNSTGTGEGEKTPMDLYAETLKEMKKVKS